MSVDLGLAARAIAGAYAAQDASATKARVQQKPPAPETVTARDAPAETFVPSLQLMTLGLPVYSRMLGSEYAFVHVFEGATEARQPIQEPSPPQFDDPQLANDWWTGLPQSERDRYITQYPEMVGAEDGLPLEDRDRANQILIDEEVVRLDTDLDASNARMSELTAERDAAFARGDWRQVHILDQEIARLESHIGGVTEQKNYYLWLGGTAFTEPAPGVPTNDHDGGTIPPPDVVILFKPNGDRNDRIVLAWGDPSTANTVTTLVPGANSDGKYESYSEDAWELREETNGDPGHATVLWVDYDPPNGTLDTGRTAAMETGGGSAVHIAEDGARELDRYYEGLGVLNPDSRHVLVTHSYGTIVASELFEHHEGVPVDDVVMIGSPGSASEPGDWLSRPDVHVLRNDDDDAATWGERYAVEKPSTWDDATQHRGEGGHGLPEYLDPATSPETDTRARIGEIIRGEDD